MSLPWGLLAEIVKTYPIAILLIPFVWILWQVYAPKYCPRVEETAWTAAKDEFRTEIDDVRSDVRDIADNVADIRETQEDHVKVTRAQAYAMNGHDETMDVEAVEEILGPDEENPTPDDFLRDPTDNSPTRGRGD